MSRARDNADLGDSYGALGAGVTGGSGLTALGTVTAGDISHADIVYPKGHWNFLEKLTTMTGSGDSQSWIWTGATSAYNNYRFIVQDIRSAVTRATLTFRILDSGSPKTSGYWYASQSLLATTSTTENSGTGQPEWRLSTDNMGGGGTIYFDVIVMNLTPNAVSGFDDSNAGITWTGVFNGEGGSGHYQEHELGGGSVSGANTNYNGVDIRVGNFVDGQVTIFGQSIY